MATKEYCAIRPFELNEMRPYESLRVSKKQTNKKQN